MAGLPQSNSPTLAVDNLPDGGKSYTSALASLTVLFFMWGFITCLNDILIPFLKVIFGLSYAQANLINLCFFGAYFLVSIPAGKLVARVGYKNGLLIGLVIAAIGCFLFYPAAGSRAYALFLGALFILASGITVLQVAANPYVAILGKPSLASARLTLTQAFNSLGVFIAPYIGSILILSHLPELDNVAPETIDIGALQIPYLVFGGILLLVSILLSRLKLPVIAHTTPDGFSAADMGRAWHRRHLVLGVIGIFTYVGAEVAIGSHIVNYLNLPDVMNMTPKEAGIMLMFYGGTAMVGRFLGAYLLGRFPTGRLLAINAVGAVLLILLSVSSTGEVAMWTLLAVGFMNSLMFSAIFTLAVADLGSLTEEASGLLCTAIVGGALIPPLFGLIADYQSLRLAFILPALCYAYIGWYGLSGHKQKTA
ncbi:sugar MFS transporter [Hymenobacter profundi]|uniref:Sugar MFS transporter n=2 Tax=Hymenobacter profundi TaxID=1982110 RepID=A0ABS6X2U7_9BACT|nr:sugar MFS transporter [Hymenobacter profundi]